MNKVLGFFVGFAKKFCTNIRKVVENAENTLYNKG